MITLENFIGNKDLLRLLRLSITAAKAKNEALPHLLLKGPAGTGKTTLAQAVAQAFGVEPIALTPNTAKKAEDLRKTFLRMPGEGYDEQGQVIGTIQPQIIFIDEIHQLSLLAQENLGIAMQDWRLPVKVNGEDRFEWVPRFTLIGATTLAGKLSKPFLDRFKLQADFETYTLDEAVAIAKLHAQSRNLRLEPGVAEAIAQRSRGVARFITRFLDRIHDAAVVAAQREGQVENANLISRQLANIVFEKFLKVDEKGLTKLDLKLLTQLAKLSEPVGVETLATITNEDKETVQSAIEPYLIQQGFLIRTKRGRLITEIGRQYLRIQGYSTEDSLRTLGGQSSGPKRLLGANKND